MEAEGRAEADEALETETGDVEVAADVEAASAPETAEPEAEETAAAADVSEDAKAE